MINFVVPKPFYKSFRRVYRILFSFLVTYEEAAGNTKEEVETKKGDKEVTFDCKVLGSSQANISWEKNDSPIDGK